MKASGSIQTILSAGLTHLVWREGLTKLMAQPGEVPAPRAGIRRREGAWGTGSQAGEPRARGAGPHPAPGAK